MTEPKQEDKKFTSQRLKSSIKTFTYGFITGLVFLRLSRYYQVRRLPNITRLQSAALSMLRGNQDVRQTIGTMLKPGLLSFHDYTGGINWRRPRISRKLSSLIPVTYEPWGIRMVFQVIGDVQSGFITMETLPGGRRDWGSDIGVKTLSVDFHNGERLVLRGSETR